MKVVPSIRAAFCIVLFVGVLLALPGCGRSITSTPGHAPNLERWVAEVRARPAIAVEPLPVMQQFETFEYSAENLRDPFSDAWSVSDAGGLRPDPHRRKETLEQYPLDSINMVGTIGSGATLVGLVMAPDKVTHRVKSGAYIGQNDGRITDVSQDHIDLVELVPDGAGGWLERAAAIALSGQ